MAGQRKQSARLAEVAKRDATIAKWSAERERAESELERIRASSGDEVLEAPERGAELSKTMQQLRDEIEIAANAINAATPKLDAARVAVLEADAVTYERRAEEFRAEYDAHRAKTDALLAELEEHECRFVPEEDWARAERWAGNVDVDLESWSVPRSGELFLKVERELAKAAVLRDVAAGVDPAARLDGLADAVTGTVLGGKRAELYPPAVWGPEAVIPAPAFINHVASVQRQLVDHDAAVAVDDGPEIERRKAVIADIDERELRDDGLRRPLTEDEERQRTHRQRWIADREAWRRDAPKVRAEIVAELEALTGGRQIAGV